MNLIFCSRLGKFQHRSVVKEFFGDTVIQRCLAHKERNIRAKLSKRHWGELARLFKRFRAVQCIEAAKDVVAELVEFLTPLNAEALKSLYEAGEDLIALQSLYVPNTLHRSLLTPNAIESRRPDGSQLLHHSDRGCQYTSEPYQKTLRTLGITCSMSRRGCCYDNAVAERFFWSLKHEWTKHERFVNLSDARLSVFKYIETFYNSVGIHLTLGYVSPNQYEAENALAAAA